MKQLAITLALLALTVACSNKTLPVPSSPLRLGMTEEQAMKAIKGKPSPARKLSVGALRSYGAVGMSLVKGAGPFKELRLTRPGMAERLLFWSMGKSSYLFGYLLEFAGVQGRLSPSARAWAYKFGRYLSKRYSTDWKVRGSKNCQALLKRKNAAPARMACTFSWFRRYFKYPFQARLDLNVNGQLNAVFLTDNPKAEGFR